MRLKIDENLHEEIADLLRDAGHDASSVWRQKMRGATDGRLADVCRAEGLAILTMDMDFSNITTYPPADYAGIIVIRLKRQSRGEVIRAVRDLLPLLPTAQINGQLWVVGETQLRIHGRSED